jgi:hypothetical protein
LGAERFLDPQLTATLWQLCQGLMEAYGAESPAMTMAIDLAVMSYFNALQIQGWIGDLSLAVVLCQLSGHECEGGHVDYSTLVYAAAIIFIE